MPICKGLFIFNQKLSKTQRELFPSWYTVCRDASEKFTRNNFESHSRQTRSADKTSSYCFPAEQTFRPILSPAALSTEHDKHNLHLIILSKRKSRGFHSCSRHHHLNESLSTQKVQSKRENLLVPNSDQSHGKYQEQTTFLFQIQKKPSFLDKTQFTYA